jgi:hypothetical protein
MRSVLALLLGIILLRGIAGCSTDHSVEAIAALNSSNIQKLTNLYSAYQASRYGPGPKDEAELKRFAKEEMGAYHLGLMHIDPNNLDTLFVSDRDHKPFKVRYGVNGGPGVVNALVFEEEGVGGKKQVGLNGGTVMEVGDSQYEEMWSGKWHPPSNPNTMEAAQKAAKSQ